jgi:geranylgeranyl diphosphate synthase type I
MAIAQLIHHLATKTLRADQETVAAAIRAADGLSAEDGELEAVLTVCAPATRWQQLCNPALPSRFESQWDSPIWKSQRVQMHALWESACPDPAYLEALGSALPSTASDTPLAASAASLLALPSLCCVALDGERQQAQPVADAWSLLYSALHLLDQIEDADTVDGAWARWGTGPTLNISTGLLASTYLALSALEDAGVQPAIARAVRDDFTTTLLHMCAGQHHDLTLHEPSLDQVWQIATAKSAVFFALACRSGAAIANVDATRQRLLGQFGHHLGLLIQIGDDISGLWSSERAQSDLRSGQRWTLPTAYTMSVSSSETRRRLHDRLRCAASDPDAEAEARQLIIGAGGVLYATAEAQRHLDQAQAALTRAVTPSAASDLLLTLLHACALPGLRCAPDRTPRAALDLPATITPTA